MRFWKYAGMISLLVASSAHAGNWKLAATNAVKDKLKDPGSAMFTEVVGYKSAKKGRFSVCGYVNAKNSYGGYVGKSRFFAVGIDEPGFTHAVAFIEDETGSTEEFLMGKYGGVCRNGWKEISAEEAPVER